MSAQGEDLSATADAFLDIEGDAQRDTTADAFSDIEGSAEIAGPPASSLGAGEVILVTEKDAVKLRGEAFEADERVFVVTLDFHPDAAFFNAFDRLLPPR